MKRFNEILEEAKIKQKFTRITDSKKFIENIKFLVSLNKKDILKIIKSVGVDMSEWKTISNPKFDDMSINNKKIIFAYDIDIEDEDEDNITNYINIHWYGDYFTIEYE